MNRHIAGFLLNMRVLLLKSVKALHEPLLYSSKDYSFGQLNTLKDKLAPPFRLSYSVTLPSRLSSYKVFA